MTKYSTTRNNLKSVSTSSHVLAKLSVSSQKLLLLIKRDFFKDFRDCFAEWCSSPSAATNANHQRSARGTIPKGYLGDYNRPSSAQSAPARTSNVTVDDVIDQRISELGNWVGKFDSVLFVPVSPT